MRAQLAEAKTKTVHGSVNCRFNTTPEFFDFAAVVIAQNSGVHQRPAAHLIDVVSRLTLEQYIARDDRSFRVLSRREIFT